MHAVNTIYVWILARLVLAAVKWGDFSGHGHLLFVIIHASLHMFQLCHTSGTIYKRARAVAEAVAREGDHRKEPHSRYCTRL